MKTAVYYQSMTGNTEKLAYAIASALPAGTSCEAIEAGTKSDADLLFVGFWTDKGTCPFDCAEFLSDLDGKKVALFGTCGMESDEAYYNGIISRVSGFIPSEDQLVGSFMFQGQMSSAIKEKYVSLLEKDPDDPRAKKMMEIYEAGIGHPNREDLLHAEEFAGKIYDSLNNEAS